MMHQYIRSQLFPFFLLLPSSVLDPSLIQSDIKFFLPALVTLLLTLWPLFSLFFTSSLPLFSLPFSPCCHSSPPCSHPDSHQRPSQSSAFFFLSVHQSLSQFRSFLSDPMGTTLTLAFFVSFFFSFSFSFFFFRL